MLAHSHGIMSQKTSGFPISPPTTRQSTHFCCVSGSLSDALRGVTLHQRHNVPRPWRQHEHTEVRSRAQQPAPTRDALCRRGDASINYHPPWTVRNGGGGTFIRGGINTKSMNRTTFISSHFRTVFVFVLEDLATNLLKTYWWLIIFFNIYKMISI